MAAAERPGSAGPTAVCLPPDAEGAYVEVIKGPAPRLGGTEGAARCGGSSVDAVLADVEVGGPKDALRYWPSPSSGSTPSTILAAVSSSAHYDALRRVKGSIEAAVERAFRAADADPAISEGPCRAARLRAASPRPYPMARGIDPDSWFASAPRRSAVGNPCRTTAADPAPGRAASALDRCDTITGEATIEPAHEALLRQMGFVAGWLTRTPVCLLCWRE